MDIELLRAADEDCALLCDRRAGFSVIVPGRPALAAQPGQPGQPGPKPAEPGPDLTVTLADLPVSLQLRSHPPPSMREPRSFLEGFVRAHATGRSPQVVKVRNLEGELLTRWGIDAAASAVYKLSSRFSTSGDSEELLALCRGGHVLTLIKRFSTEPASQVGLTLLGSALSGTLSWHGSPPPAAPPKLWPPSRILLPGLFGRLTAECRARAERLAPTFAMDEDDRAALGVRIETLLTGSEAPAAVLKSDALLQATRFIAQVCPRPAQEDAVAELLKEVRTAHDLRGAALLLLHILQRRPATFGD